MNNRGCTAIVCLLVFAAFSTEANSQGVGNWQDMIGTWRGDGEVRISPTAPLEQGACRIEVDAPDQRTLNISGRCATAGQSGTISTQLNRNEANQITGVATSPLVSQSVDFVGEQSDNRVVLRTPNPVDLDGELYTVQSELVGWDDRNSFTLVQAVVPNNDEPIIVFQMRFERTP